MPFQGIVHDNKKQSECTSNIELSQSGGQNAGPSAVAAKDEEKTITISRSDSELGQQHLLPHGPTTSASPSSAVPNDEESRIYNTDDEVIDCRYTSFDHDAGLTLEQERHEQKEQYQTQHPHHNLPRTNRGTPRYLQNDRVLVEVDLTQDGGQVQKNDSRASNHRATRLLAFFQACTEITREMCQRPKHIILPFTETWKRVQGKLQAIPPVHTWMAPHVQILVLGQVLSVALTVPGAVSEAMFVSYSFAAPTSLLLGLYLLIMVVHLPLWIYHKKKEHISATLAATVSTSLELSMDCSFDPMYHATSDVRVRPTLQSPHRTLHVNTLSPCGVMDPSTGQSATDLAQKKKSRKRQARTGSPAFGSVSTNTKQQTSNQSRRLDPVEVAAHLHLVPTRYIFPVPAFVLRCFGCRDNHSGLPLIGASWQWYAFLAVLHVESNYFLFVSFEYTSFKTISLLDSLAIPAAIFASVMFLRRRYCWVHLLGAMICILGATVTILGDYIVEEKAQAELQVEEQSAEAVQLDWMNNSTSRRRLIESNINNSTFVDGESTAEALLYPHALWGDCLAIIAALLVGLNDVLTEQTVRACGSSGEYLAMLGLFGVLTTIVQMLVLGEWRVLGPYVSSIASGDEADDRNNPPPILFGFFAVAAYAFYGLMTQFLLVSEAALLNLSLLSGDLYAAIFSVVEEGIYPTFLFYVSFVLIVVGVHVYEKAPHSPIVKDIDGNIILEDDHYEYPPPAEAFPGAFNHAADPNGPFSDSSSDFELKSISQLEHATVVNNRETMMA
jgi:drug/metabolite transporter (DMT)-like permease